MPTKYDPVYYERHKVAHAAKQQRYYDRHPGIKKVSADAYRNANKERLNTMIREYYRQTRRRSLPFTSRIATA